jgi:transposase
LILQERVCSASSRNFETNLRRERQLEGVAKAKAAGVYKGRPAQIDADQVRKMKADGMGPTEIAEALKIGRASVYRVLARLNLSLLLAEFRDRRLPNRADRPGIQPCGSSSRVSSAIGTERSIGCVRS